MIGAPRATEALGKTAARRFGDAAAGFVSRLAALAALLLAGCSTGPAPATMAAPIARDSVRATAAPAAARAVDRLDGLRAAELVALLGEPELRRVDPPAELWQYRTARCVLDVYLYADGNGVRVRHAETRERDALGPAAGDCPDPGMPLDARVRQSRL